MNAEIREIIPLGSTAYVCFYEYGDDFDDDGKYVVEECVIVGAIIEVDEEGRFRTHYSFKFTDPDAGDSIFNAIEGGYLENLYEVFLDRFEAWDWCEQSNKK